MMRKLKVSEYAKLMQCDDTTVYRWIKAGKVDTEKVDGVLHVLVDETELQTHATASAESVFIVQLQAEIERLSKELDRKNEGIDKLQQELSQSRQQIDEARQRYDEQIQQLQTDLIDTRQRHDALIQQMQQDAEADKERSDTIILQLTQQLSSQTKLIEDMRQKDNQKKRGFFKRLLGKKER